MSREKRKTEAGRWLKQAESDLQAAEASLKAGFCEWACFQRQQAAGKAIRAIWYDGGFDPRGHSVATLMREFPDEGMRAKLACLDEDAADLDKLYVPTRYPNGLPEPIPADACAQRAAADALTKTRRIVEHIEKALG